MAVFKMSDFIKMAIKDEETGEAFYLALAENTKNDAFKKGFTKIAQQEKGHAQRFRSMLEEVGDKTPFQQYPGQYDNFLTALLETRAFPDPEKAVAKVGQLKDEYEGIEIAMRLEKDTMLFYYQMLPLIPDTHKKYVEEIIDEEKGHLEQLAQL